MRDERNGSLSQLAAKPITPHLDEIRETADGIEACSAFGYLRGLADRALGIELPA